MGVINASPIARFKRDLLMTRVSIATGGKIWLGSVSLYVGLAGFALAIVSGGCAGGEMDQLEVEAIIEETQAFADAMNAGNAALAASFYTEDGTRVGGFGDIQHGREEIAAAYDRLLNQSMPGERLTQERGTVRMLTQELAVWRGALEIVVPGSDAPLRGHAVHVVKKIDGRWLILEGHPKIFPPPPNGGS